MAIKDWISKFTSTSRSTAKDDALAGGMQTLVSRTDKTRVSQIHAVRDSLINAQSRIIAIEQSGPIVVTNFGVASDGTTDCSTALQAIADGLSGGERLFFPPGTYKLGSQVRFKTGNLELYGSAGSKFVLANGFSVEDSIRFEALSGALSKFRIHHLEFDFNADGIAAGTNHYWLRFYKCSDVEIWNCKLLNSATTADHHPNKDLVWMGFVGYSDSVISKIRVHDCEQHLHTWEAPSAFAWIDFADDSEFRNNLCGGFDTFIRYGKGCTRFSCVGNRIIGNAFVDIVGGTPGVTAELTKGGLVQNNQWVNSGAANWYTGASFISIANYDDGHSGYIDSVTVDGNICEPDSGWAQTFGVHVRDMSEEGTISKIVVTNNKIGLHGVGVGEPIAYKSVVGGRISGNEIDNTVNDYSITIRGCTDINWGVNVVDKTPSIS